MSEANFIAHCAYCDSETRLYSLKHINSVLSCSSCGAPLKAKRDIHPPRPKPYKPHRLEVVTPHKKPKKKSRRGFSFRRAAFEVFEEVIDEITDIFD